MGAGPGLGLSIAQGVIEGHGGTFSLEGPEGKAFHTRSRVFTAVEMVELDETDRRPA